MGGKCTELNYRKCETSKIDFLILTPEEEEAMEPPTLWRCKNCGEAFPLTHGNVLIFIDEEYRRIGYFFCFDCIKELHPEGCQLEAYEDGNRFSFICDNCPVHPLECDVRNVFFKIKVESGC